MNSSDAHKKERPRTLHDKLYFYVKCKLFSKVAKLLNSRHKLYLIAGCFQTMLKIGGVSRPNVVNVLR